MKQAKISILMTAAILLSGILLGAQRSVCAQEASPDQGAWSASGTTDSDAKTTKPQPMNITGCWSGTVTDTADGTGTAQFEFHQNGNLKKLRVGSTFDFEWSDSAFARGPLKGSVTSSGLKFKGSAGAGCELHGIAAGNDTGLTGTVIFTGNCADFFQSVTFSIVPGCS